MSATIQIGDVQATITDWEWSCPDKRLQTILNGLLAPDGPSGADPNPDFHAAMKTVEILGGEVVSYDATEYEPGRIY